jgi:hypothetical protein
MIFIIITKQNSRGWICLYLYKTTQTPNKFICKTWKFVYIDILKQSYSHLTKLLYIICKMIWWESEKLKTSVYFVV